MRQPFVKIRSSKDMRELSINVFSQQLKSGAPVPGGGGASALMGAVAACLSSMVANLTTGKKKYAQYQEDIDRILIRTEELRSEMIDLIEKDAEVFEPLSKAYSIPKEQEGRDEILQKCLKEAALAPFEILKKARKVSLIVEELAQKGSRLAISDVGVAASACTAAATGAAMNVYINTKLMTDREYAITLNRNTDELVDEIRRRCDKAYAEVKESLIS